MNGRFYLSFGYLARRAAAFPTVESVSQLRIGIQRFTLEAGGGLG
jgi:hypothetical protein